MEENKEMDIFTVLYKFGKGLCSFLKRIGQCLGKMLQLTYRYKVLFACFTIAAVAYGFYETTGDRRIYRGDMTISINDGDAFQYAELANSLDQYVKDLDHDGLAQALHIPNEIAEEVRFIKPYFQIDMNNDSTCDFVDFENTFAPSDTCNIRLRTGLVISVGMNSTDHYEEMETAIMDFFFDNQYFQDLNMARIAYLSDFKASLENDFRQIDSLQKIEYFQKHENGVNLTKELKINTDKQMFYYNKVDILNKKREIAMELAADQDIAVVTSKFQPTKKPVNRKSVAIGKNVTYAYLLFLMLAFALKNKKEIMDYLKEKK